MKIKLLSQLSDDEKVSYSNSDLFKLVCTHYSLYDLHLSYYKEYFGPKWIDLSTIAYDDNGYYIALYAFTDGVSLSFFGSPFDIVCIDVKLDHMMRAYQELFAKIDIYHNEYKFSKILFNYNPIFCNKYYVANRCTYTIEHISYIDLHHSEDDIKMCVRKSYKSLINWGVHNLQINIYNSTNITEPIFDQFEQFHIQVSKRRTRSHQSWSIQYDAVKKDEAFLLFGYLDGNLVSAVFVLNSISESYYGVAVNDRNLMANNLPLGHFLLLKAIFYSKEKGYNRFILGNVNNSDDLKIDAIAKYKRGFSPTIFPQISYEYIYE